MDYPSLNDDRGYGGVFSETTFVGTDATDNVRVYGQAYGTPEDWRMRPIWQVLTDPYNVLAWGLTYPQAIAAAEQYRDDVAKYEYARMYACYIEAHQDRAPNGRIVFGSVPYYPVF